MKITADELLSIMPGIGAKLGDFINPLNSAMEEFEINTYPRIAMFLAQLAVESGEFRYMEEIASGAAYDNRIDLGNTQPEAIRIANLNGTTPGRFFKGHGPIQNTGYFNHLAVAKALNIDCVSNPLLLTYPIHGCRAAAFFWKSHGLNEIADGDNENAFKFCVHKVNGGKLTYADNGSVILENVNGYPERKAYWERANECLGA